MDDNPNMLFRYSGGILIFEVYSGPYPYIMCTVDFSMKSPLLVTGLNLFLDLK
jgi:hypothetical protein